MGKKIIKQKGDTLEVKLRDSNYNPIYRNEFDARNDKDLAKLIYDLKHNGVDLEKALRKISTDDLFW